jgi:hypothetical protein
VRLGDQQLWTDGLVPERVPVQRSRLRQRDMLRQRVTMQQPLLQSGPLRTVHSMRDAAPIVPLKTVVGIDDSSPAASDRYA